ncbi:MAG: TRAP transporter small permease subunit, partial [Betaproteobacteria bacterium]|nr:TRAP transporter small permease subunit [Betaproteobacteria bacterium]
MGRQAMMKPIGRALDAISRWLNHAGTLLIVAAMVLITSDVIGRGMGSPVRGVPEMVGASIIAIVFLQLAHSLRSGRMIRSDSFLVFLGRRRPAYAHALESVFALAGSVLFAATAYAAYPLVIEAIKAETFIGVSGYFTMPIWPVKLVVVVGCVLVLLVYLRLAYDKASQAMACAPWVGD